MNIKSALLFGFLLATGTMYASESASESEKEPIIVCYATIDQKKYNKRMIDYAYVSFFNARNERVHRFSWTREDPCEKSNLVGSKGKLLRAELLSEENIDLTKLKKKNITIENPRKKNGKKCCKGCTDCKAGCAVM